MSRQSASADGREPAEEPDRDPVTVVRRALATAVASLAALDEHDPGAESAAKRVLNTLAETLLPIQTVLISATESDPGGPLARALGFLRNAVGQIEDGDVAAARAAVITAHIALTCLDTHDSAGGDTALGDSRL